MAIQVVCGCGRHLRVSEAHAGRPVKCPGCGATHVVPAERFAAGDSPVQAGPGLAPASGRRARWVVLAVLLLALLGAGVAGWWFLFRKGPTGPDIDDLSLIPFDAQGFVSIRLAELWKAPATRKALEEVRRRDAEVLTPDVRLERDTGLRPEDVERFSFAALDPTRRAVWAIIKTFEPYDRREVLSRLNRRREQVHEGKSYFTGEYEDGRSTALYFASPRVLVIGPEEGIKTCLRRLDAPAPPGPKPLGPAIARCNEPHHVVAGLNPSAGSPDALLANVRLATATVDVGEEAVVEARARTGSREQAEKLHESIKDKIDGLKGLLVVMALLPGEKGKAAKQIRNLLGGLKIERDGDELTATVKVDGATAAAGMIALPGLLGQ
jgi:hypothetical protein